MTRRHHTLKVMASGLFLAGRVLTSAFFAQFAHAQNVVSTVSVGSRPWAVAYDASKGEIFVANYHDNTASAISALTNHLAQPATYSTAHSHSPPNPPPL